MRTFKTVAEAGAFRRACSEPLVLVPTMGALHEGHGALIQSARQQAGREGKVVVSIFVNPAQFGANEDFDKYPRTFEADLELCRRHGADAVFAPSTDEIYPAGDSTFVEETKLSQGLCGTHRPGHFRGVCTVVAKLFNIVRPDAAVFGEKDYQQLAILRRMARDLFFGIEIIGSPTVREPDGLAMSSRNRYLNTEERKRAAAFPTALVSAAGEATPERIMAKASALIAEGTGAEPEYVAVVDAESLEPLASLGGPAVLAAAVKIGQTRLIDNVRLAPPHGKV